MQLFSDTEDFLALDIKERKDVHITLSPVDSGHYVFISCNWRYVCVL